MEALIRPFREARPGRLAALALWIAVIWGQSLVPGDASASESGLILELLAPLIRALGVTDMELAHTILRKIGHFSEYLVLAILAVRALGPRALPAIAAVGMAVPCIDETIQLFVPGRCGAVRDVLIDLAGFAVGLMVCLPISRLRRWRRA